MTKTYLGDGVYAEVKNAFDIVLTAEDGVSTYAKIHLEFGMLESLYDYARRTLKIKA